jgi:hypothetical protein
VLQLETAGWASGPVRPASRWLDRLVGLVPRADHGLLLIPCRSVHGVGLLEPLWVVGLDRDGHVRRVGLLAPGGTWCDPGAQAVLELPWWRDPPPPGERLVAGPIA